ncbi:MFS transporter [Streptomyces sp. cg36]|uniref:MFS transporter n=1 Tax=Streptomyces sp. cg36 TaxID=3238798 RepID=UPI0034E22448
MNGTTATAQPAPHRLLAQSLIFMGMSLAVISSLGAPLIPQIATSYHVSLAVAQWSLTITLLAGAIATPVFGRLGDGPHRRTVTYVAIGAALAGCVLAALPLGFTELLVGRALQGVGVALTPLAIATARDNLPEARAKSTVSMVSIATAAGVGLGYPLTGLIAQGLGLHAAFWFGALMSAGSLFAARAVLPATRHLTHRPLDKTGALLLGLGLAGILVVLSDGGTWGWASVRVILLAVLSVLVLAIWVVHELRTRHPLVDLRVARSRAVVAANVIIVLLGIGLYLMMSLVTRLAQAPTLTGYGFGASIAVTGLALLPFSVTSVLANKGETALGRRMSARHVLILACGIFLLSQICFALAHSALWHMFLAMGVMGLGVGCAFAVIPNLVVRAVPANETGSAISFNQVLRCVGYTIGSALSATVLQASTPAGKLLPTSGGYTMASLVGIALALLTVLVAVTLAPRHAAARTAVTHTAPEGTPVGR